MKRIIAVLVLLASFGVMAGASPAAGAAPSAGVYDCSTNPDGTSWSAWNYLSDKGAGKWCPSPTIGDYAVHSWDRKADGMCASVGYQLTPGATVYRLTSTTVCGNGYVGTAVVNNGWTVVALYTVIHVSGGWMNTPGTLYEQLW